MGITSRENYLCKLIGFSLSCLSLSSSIFTVYLIGTMCQWRLIRKISSMARVQLRNMSLTSKSADAIKLKDLENKATISDDINPIISMEPANTIISRNIVLTNEDTTTSIKKGEGHINRKLYTRFNGYLLLVASMTLCEMLYDINYMLKISSSPIACYTWQFLEILGGLSLSIWTNIISFVIMYVVIYLRSVDIFSLYGTFIISAVGGPLILALLEVTMSDSLKPTDDDAGCGSAGNLYIYRDIYSSWRVVCIVANIAAYLVISIKMYRMAVYERAKLTTSAGLSGSGGIQVSDDPSAALNALVLRLKYYPIIQIFSRGGGVWSDFNSNANLVSSLLSAICSPSLGICYFLLFLYMQPKALNLTKQILCSCCLSKSKESGVNSVRLENLPEESIYTLDDDELEYIINQNYSNSIGSARDSAVGQIKAADRVFSFSTTFSPDVY